MRKAYVFTLLVLFTLILMGLSKPNPIKLNVHDQLITDLPDPVIVNNTVLVPIRAVSYLGSYQINWSSKTKTVTIQDDNTKDIITLTVGQSKAYKNNKAFELKATPRVYNNSVFVPLRFVSEAFDNTVVWDKNNNGVALFLDNPESITLLKSDDLSISRQGAIGLRRVSWHEEEQDQPEGMTYSYIFPEGESKRFYYLKSGVIFYYEVREGKYAELIWSAKINDNGNKSNLKDSFSNYIGAAFTSNMGTQPTIEKRLVFFDDMTFVYGTGQYGIIDTTGDIVKTYEVQAKQLSEIIIPVPEEEM